MDYKRRKKPSITSSQLSLSARGLAPIPNYVIIPVAGSLVGDIPILRDDPERANAVVAHMIEKHGARRRQENLP